MSHHHPGQRHQSLRRKGVIKTAARKTLADAVDIAIYVIGGLSLLLTIDQVRIIWVDHNASGISIPAWTCYLVSSCVWMWYGYLHKDRVILILNGLWVIMYIVIVVGALIY